MKRNGAKAAVLLLLGLSGWGVRPIDAAASYSVAVQSDVAYGPLPEEVLDICSPEGVTGPVPAFVDIHGGAWQQGDKSDPFNADVCQLMASMGYVVFNIDYRLVQNDATSFPNPGAADTWPDQIVDAQLAVRWIRHHAAAYGVDPGHVCAFGDSAGAQLAEFLGVVSWIYPGDQAGLYSDDSPAANCVIDNSGPSNLTLAPLGALNPHSSGSYLWPEQLANSGDASVLKTISPIFYVTPQSAPMVITQGAFDVINPPQEAKWMQTALEDNGVPVQLISYDAGHVFEGLTLDETVGYVTQTIDWSIANFAPAPATVVVVSPAGGALLHGTVTLSGTAAHSPGTVVSVSVSIDGAAPIAASGTSQWTLALDTRALANAAHTLQVTAVDDAGFSASSTVRVRVFNPRRLWWAPS